MIQKWPLYSKDLINMLTVTYNAHIYTQWPEDIQNVLILLKLLPATKKAKKTNDGQIELFSKAMEKLFVFRKVIDKPIPIIQTFFLIQ